MGALSERGHKAVITLRLFAFDKLVAVALTLVSLDKLVVVALTLVVSISWVLRQDQGTTMCDEMQCDNVNKFSAIYRFQVNGQLTSNYGSIS